MNQKQNKYPLVPLNYKVISELMLSCRPNLVCQASFLLAVDVENLISLVMVIKGVNNGS